MTRGGWRGEGQEKGSVSAELVLITPLLILFLLLVVAFGRLAQARLQVDAAAAQAARAASIARDPATAASDAQAVAAASLSGSGITCGDMTVSVDTSDFMPGGSVGVTVDCSVDLADLAGLRLPGTQTISSSFVEPIDLYRGIS